MPHLKNLERQRQKNSPHPPIKPKMLLQIINEKMDAEFEKHASRAAEAVTTADSLLQQQPVAQPYPGMMPVFMLPQSPGMAPPYMQGTRSSVPSDNTPNDSGNSLFQRLGNLIGLGVDVASAGLQGGLELIGGSVAGQGACCYQPGYQHHSACCDCNETCCGCEKNNCYSSCCDDCCCKPWRT